jgi:hypothetical protein
VNDPAPTVRPSGFASRRGMYETERSVPEAFWIETGDVARAEALRERDEPLPQQGS